uniref:Sodium- and chloride-dependent GABA transporter 2-like n=1 Tax=Sinocyclocheilus grahami TaxID=75366 RepID=A0A672PD30_SINGR
MAFEQGVDISMVAESGPGLAFIAYPRAVAMMPLSQLWSICFFLMIILLGLDSEGGLYIFQLFDYYSCSGMTLLLFAIAQSICIGWFYGADRLYENIVDMIGYRPLTLMKYSWKYITPIVCIGTFVFSLVKFTPLKFNNTFEYPWWGYAVGWWFTLSSTLMVPIWMIYVIIITPGTLKQVIPYSTTCPMTDRETLGDKKHPWAVFWTTFDIINAFEGTHSREISRKHKHKLYMTVL